MHQRLTSLHVCVTSLEPVLAALLLQSAFLGLWNIMAICLDSISYWTVLVALGSFSYYVGFILARFGAREKHLPPGPPTYPIVGNAHLVADKHLYKRLAQVLSRVSIKLSFSRFKEWSEKYGEVFSLKIGKGTMIVLNSRRAVYDLIDKRSSIYSGRIQDEQFLIALKGENIANLSTDATWRAQRKVTARFFAPSKLDGELAGISDAE